MEFRIGDKVLQVRNNYDKIVFNGDIGVITDINFEDRSLTVSIDDRLISYDVFELDELTLAYAVTIHKSQGSEYGEVLLGMPSLSGGVGDRMLTRELLYTGVTRARRRAVVFGDRAALLATLARRVVRHSGMDWWDA